MLDTRTAAALDIAVDRSAIRNLRTCDDQVCIDPRTLQPGDDKDLIQALKDLA